MIRFESIQLEPEPGDDAKAEALAESDSILSLLLEGEDFEELAARFSDGPSASAGGELGWVREDGGLVPEFEEVVFQLGAGMISNPVETDFGYHVILVERVRGGERRVRHILFEPEVTDIDAEANDRRVEEYAARLRAGETMTDLGQEPDTFELSLQQIGQGSPALGTAMRDVEVGDIVGPVPMVGLTAADGWTLAKVLGKTGGGRGEFSDFRELIEDRLRSQGLTDTVIEELRSRSHIDIRLGTDRP